LTMARLLAFIDIFVDSSLLGEVVNALTEFPNVEEIYEVTGEYDVFALVSAEGIEEFRDFLKNKVLKIPGIKSTFTSILRHSAKGHRNHTETEKQTKSATV